MNPRLATLIRSYARKGRVKAGEILLAPDLAVAFVGDLERLGVEIDGVDFWRALGERVVEIPWGQGTVGCDAAARAMDARRTIIERRPPEADYVSLVFPDYFFRD